MPRVVQRQTPILAPGIWIPDGVKVVKSRRGFTILEILVVIAVVSIIASTILLNTQFKRPAANLKQHASTIGKTLKLLLQEAIINDRNFALSIEPGGYRVLLYDGENFIPSKEKFYLKLQKEHVFIDELIVDDQVVVIDKKKTPEPHILILSSGEMTVFQWDIEDQENRLKVRINSTFLGDIKIEGPMETFI